MTNDQENWQNKSGDDIFAWTVEWAEKTHVKFWQVLETGSTNAVARSDEATESKPQMPKAPALTSAPTIYLTRHQTGGRGRGDHTWDAEAGAALLGSWSFAMRSVPQPVFSPLSGLALYEAAKAVWPELAFNLKAPNDLYVGALKVAGLLIETVEMGPEKRTVIGLGLNVFAHPKNIPTATCLRTEMEKLGLPKLSKNDWHNFLLRWTDQLTQAAQAGQATTLIPAVSERLRNALNLHPLLKEEILRVDELGQLHMKSRTIHWHEL